MEVGRIVRAAREARRWSRSELATESGLSRVMVEQIERGRRDPSLRTLERLLAAMGLRGELRVHRDRDATPVLLTPQERARELERRLPWRLVSGLTEGGVRFAVGGELALLMHGFGVPVTETLLVLWDDDDNLARASVALREVSAGPATEDGGALRRAADGAGAARAPRDRG